jgi:hypothetical protein
MLIMAMTKHAKRGERVLTAGKKCNFFSEHNGMELDGRQLGWIGMGRIRSRMTKSRRIRSSSAWRAGSTSPATILGRRCGRAGQPYASATSAEVAPVERALAWVLRMLALEGDRVGLRRPAFG